jgi:transposase-like protein
LEKDGTERPLTRIIMKTKHLSKSECQAIIKAVHGSSTLMVEIKKRKVSYAKWRRLCDEYDLDGSSRRGRRPTTYTEDVLKQIRKLVSQGSYLTDACKSVGVNHSNFLRWCRRLGITAMTAAQRARNRKRQYQEMVPRASKRMRKMWADGKMKGVSLAAKRRAAEKRKNARGKGKK